MPNVWSDFMTSLDLAGLSFQKVNSCSVFIGENKGGWIYAGQRPRHEVRLPDFYIMESSLSEEELTEISKKLDIESNSNQWDEEKLNILLNYLDTQFHESDIAIEDKSKWEIRCPSQGEWYASLENKKIIVKTKARELLSDGTSSNHRGAMMDGRPKKFEGFGPMQYHKAVVEIHPSKIDITALSSIPMDRPNNGVSVRFVISPVRQGDIVKVPQNADFFSNFKVEIFWTFVLGIIPSFAIPIFRGMGSYATDGWVNLLFGGLCVGFVSGAFWRPRRPTIMYEQGETVTTTRQ
ncbi:MAG: hypothetical protein CMA81_05290 [Euryarchaeota archaeon]|nr:hypothetical protein [Euryarchaeota archaeon]